MIDQKVITGIMFGAGCLLGVRSCSNNNLSSTTIFPWVNEIHAHINHLLHRQNMHLDIQTLQAYAATFDARQEKKFRKFLNSIYVIHFQHRETFNLIWHLFSAENISYERFQLLQDKSSVRVLLLACAQCVDYWEQLIECNNDVSSTIENFLMSEIDPRELFNKLLKPIIELRVHGLLPSERTATKFVQQPKTHVRIDFL